MQTKPNFYAVIPANVRYDSELSPNAKLLYGEITALSNSEGFCWATNGYFAELYNVTNRSIQNWISLLEKKGLIRVDVSKENPFASTRKIYISTHEEKFAPSRKNVHAPHEDNFTTPHEDNFTHNNKGLNTTNNNKKNKDLKNIRSNSDELESNSTEILTLPKNGTPSKKLSSSQLETEFDQLWAIYPKKLGKKKAFDSFKKARNDKKIPYEDIENGLYKYVKHLQTEETEAQFIMHGSTWFNQEKWQDEYITHAPKRKPRNMTEYVKQKYGSGGLIHESRGNGEVTDYSETPLSELWQRF